MENSLIVVKQLPVIEERLMQLKESITQRTEEAMALVCTEDTRQAVKSTRATLNKEFKEYEELRKSVKTSVMKPYEDFEQKYRTCVTDAYRAADASLKKKIDAVESEIKETKTAEIEAYFDEVREGLNIPENMISLSKTGIKVNLSSSVSKLKQQVYDFLNKISGEVKYINGLEHSEEILVEYWKSLDMLLAVKIVEDRRKRIEEQRHHRQEQAQEQAAREAAVEQVELAVQEQSEREEMLQTPVAKQLPEEERSAVPEYADAPAQEEKKHAASFTVYGTMDQLRALAAFLREGGYEYETIR